MAKLKHMVGLKVISGFKGVIDFYYWMGIPCARAWPKSPGKLRSAAVMAQWPVWAQANATWHLISPTVRAAYKDMTTGTNLTTRDMFIRGYIAGTLRYFTPVDDLEEP